MSYFKFHPYFALICIKSDIHSSLKEQLHSLEYLPALFGVPRYLKDASNNITCGALKVLRYLLPRCPLSTDLLASLKQPFNDEVISMDPSSSHRARNLIHKYLMVSGTSLVDYGLTSQHYSTTALTTEEDCLKRQTTQKKTSPYRTLTCFLSLTRNTTICHTSCGMDGSLTTRIVLDIMFTVLSNPEDYVRF